MTLTTLIPLPVMIVNTSKTRPKQGVLTRKQTPNATCSPQIFASVHQSPHALSASFYRSTALRSLDCLVAIRRLCDQVHFQSIQRCGNCARRNATNSTRDKVAYIGHKIRQFELPSRWLDRDIWVILHAYFLVLDVVEASRGQLRRLRCVRDRLTGCLRRRELLERGI